MDRHFFPEQVGSKKLRRDDKEDALANGRSGLL
jgi:hypothetical protein